MRSSLNVTIQPFGKEDVPRFLELAQAEQWRSDPWEFDALLSLFPSGCFVARDASCLPVGFVTAFRHDRSGWIGNLIVAAQYRGRGIGRELFCSALEVLRAAPVKTVWLTASESGKPLYEKHGFCSIDTIVRYNGTSSGIPSGRAYLDVIPNRDLDMLGWGDNRGGLLAEMARQGVTVMNTGAFGMLQECGNAVQLGPFAARNSNAAGRLLGVARGMAPKGTTICLDVPAGNRIAPELLKMYGFSAISTNELMYAGTYPAYRPEYIYGLATMGSFG